MLRLPCDGKDGSFTDIRTFPHTVPPARGHSTYFRAFNLTSHDYLEAIEEIIGKVYAIVG